MEKIMMDSNMLETDKIDPDLMDKNFYKKVINASAGTGKTYRLSLEFINLLLSYREVMTFDEILVITFTKKATAEIRERIFSHLQNIVEQTEDGVELFANLQTINRDLRADDETLTYLREVYEAMLTDKQSLKVSTIDSFTNTVFNGLIAPYYNISDYSVDPHINDDYLPELFDAVLSEHNDLELIFREVKGRNLKSYENLIKTILQYRWVFHFRQQMEAPLELPEPELLFQDFVFKYNQALKLFHKYLTKYDVTLEKGWGKILKKDFLKIMGSGLNSVECFADDCLAGISNEKFIVENYSFFLKGEGFWNGVSHLRKKADTDLKLEILEILESASESLAAYLFVVKVLPEQQVLESLANRLFAKYDEIKFRDKIFTYDDISYYTYRYLYDPEISIIDDQNVLNLFYEQLSYNVRFTLIDEFQDTSVLQWNILLPIISEITSGVGQKPYGGVIIVGDEKQSIYGWRGGERDLLLKAPQFIEMEEEAEILSTSYRTKLDLMNFINQVFMSDELHSSLLIRGIDWPYGEVAVPASITGGYVQLDLHNRGKVKDIRDQKLEKSDVYRQYIENVIVPMWRSGELNPASTAVLARKNSDLDSFAHLLEEYEIDYVLESSASLLQHKAIKPILSLLNYLIYDDPYEFIRFLRSDLVLLESKILKSMLIDLSELSNRKQFFEKWVENSFLKRVIKISEEVKKKNISELLKLCLEEFRVSDIFSHELDLKNLHHFLEIAAEFEAKNQDYSAGLSGFLSYCRAIEKKEEFSQLSLLESNAIKLLTVHKSKGLEFETLFCLFDIGGRGGNFGSGLNIFHNFNKMYNGFANSVLTFSYADIVAKSPYKILATEKENQAAVEELNNIYVALTRVKKNLFLLLQVDSSKPLAKYLAEIGKKSEPKISELFLKSVLSLSDNSEMSEIYSCYKIGEFIGSKIDEIAHSNPVDLDGNDFFGLAEKGNVEKVKPPQWEVLHSSYLTKRNVMKGNIVHDYLSFIEFDSTQSRDAASKLTIGKYGTLFNRPDIDQLIDSANRFIDSHEEYFSIQKWELAFNEKIIFDAKAEEFRIDRMLVSRERKEVLILDYKTGETYDEAQLNNYKKIISELPICKDEGYSINTKFLEVEI